LSCDFDADIRLAVVAVLPPKSTKARENPRKFELTAVKVIQGHWSWCQWKAHMQLPISD